MDWGQKLAAALSRPQGFDWDTTKRLADFQTMADSAPVGAVGAPSGLTPYSDPSDPFSAQDALAALSFAPVFGDVAGLAGDAAMYATDPSSRTPGNYAMTAAGALPFVPSAKAAMLAKALAAKAGGLPALSAITAWHGTPHIFDKFDASKIGTGEGAQAYGHGLYLAEAPEVANQYRAVGTDARHNIEGAPPRPQVSRLGPDRDLAAAYDDAITKAKSLGLDGAISYYQDQVRLFPKYADEYQKPLQQLLEMKAAGAKSTLAGNVYSVDLPDEHIARMLDWDAPLSEQQHVIEALAKSRSKAAKDTLSALGDVTQSRTLYGEDLGQATGKDLHSLLSLNFSGKASGSNNASQTLQKAGIPGIKYFDGISRGAGQGTRNFVVFPGEEGALRILTRNGEPLP